MDLIIDIPFVFLDIIILAGFQLGFINVFIPTKSVDGLATVGADC